MNAIKKRRLWMPIATAPKDGRVVAVRCVKKRQVIYEGAMWFFRGGDDAGDFGNSWLCGGGGKNLEQPTHWRWLKREECLVNRG